MQHDSANLPPMPAHGMRSASGRAQRGPAGAARSIRRSSCGSDPHIQCATSIRTRLIGVATMPGRAVMIQFEPGEHMINRARDRRRQSVAHGHQRQLARCSNRRAPQPETQPYLVTNRRTYPLSLVSVSAASASDMDAAFRLSRYAGAGGDRAAAPSAGGDAPRWASARPVSGPVGSAATTWARETALPRPFRPPIPVHYARRSCIAPTALGTTAGSRTSSTQLRVTCRRSFTILPDGSEATANFHMEGDTVVVHETVEIVCHPLRPVGAGYPQRRLFA